MPDTKSEDDTMHRFSPTGGMRSDAYGEYCLFADMQRAELVFLKHVAEMRATCDKCGKKKVMVALAEDGKWKCFDCTKPNTRIADTGGANAIKANRD